MAEYQYLDSNHPDGTIVGQNATSKVGMYGTAPVVQQAVGAAVATTDLTTTGILAVINAYNTLIEKLKLIGAVKT